MLKRKKAESEVQKEEVVILKKKIIPRNSKQSIFMSTPVAVVGEERHTQLHDAV